MNILKSASFIAAGALLAGASCGTPAKTSSAVTVNSEPTVEVDSPVSAIPSVRIYKTSKDVDNLVPIVLDAQGKIASYPAPTDITASSAPVRLAGGYLLDRCGIAPTSVFTSYTFEEYSRLPQAPTPEQLLKEVVPGACVTEIVAMPFPITAADVETRCNRLIDEGLPGCKEVFRQKTLTL